MGRWLKSADLFFSARPMLQIPVWSIYLVCLHYHHELSGKRFDWWHLLMLFCLSLISAGSYWWNQVYDEESDRVNDKLGFLQRKLLTRPELTAAFLISSVVGLAMAWLFSALIFVIFAQAFYLSFAYSAPPFSFKDRPVWGLIANAWGLGFLVPFCVMPEMTVHNAGLLGWDNPVYFFLAVGSIYLLTTVPDRTGDELAGKRTIAIVLGATGTMFMALALILLSAVVAFRSDNIILVILSLISSGMILPAIFVRSSKFLLAAAKTPILLLTLLAGYFYPVYLLFIIVLVISTRLYYNRRFDMSYPRLT